MSGADSVRANIGIIDTAARELSIAAGEMFGNTPSPKHILSTDPLYTKSNANANIALKLTAAQNEPVGAFSITADGSTKLITISSASGEGLLYGAFRLIFLMRTVGEFSKLNCSETPASALRMLNHWDNLDGSIERGYSGNSFFFENDKVIIDDRTEAYARLVASVGINAVVINNVNVRAAATKLISAVYRKEIKALVNIFKKYGIRLFLSLNFAAPMELGGLEGSDPCDEKVRAWWKRALDELFTDVPELGGFLIKADSEGRPGPFTYGRTHADGANMLADIIAPYGGLVIWRCFVYNCKQDWRDTVTDRAKAQYDNFMPLDGEFRDNVILQIKNGPMDFQVREPVSPLFSGLKKTNELIEFQIAQEYTGQQKHVFYLIPQFKEVLEFKTYIRDDDGRPMENDTVCDIVTGKTFGNANSGMAAVANTGNDANWTGHDLAAANLFGFGRLAFNPGLSAEEIAKEWTALTFGNDEVIFQLISYILNTSRPAYEKYTAPLGVGWMVNPGHHYGPNVDGYEFSEWGTYHRSDAEGMGVERGAKGTGYIAQYNEPNASLYENLETCPDELLLFMHHVPYTYRLHSGKTVIQHIYDSHYEGAEEAVRMRSAWCSLKDKIDRKRFERVLARFDLQVESAAEWRDAICTYYRQKSGIADEKGRI
ncbi:MAG: alpha-glucuronidase [Lachnospiraceae bacterium]|nr:alpha-glucuronidase [Lachnospiraceae bacterium]